MGKKNAVTLHLPIKVACIGKSTSNHEFKDARDNTLMIVDVDPEFASVIVNAVNSYPLVQAYRALRSAQARLESAHAFVGD